VVAVCVVTFELFSVAGSLLNRENTGNFVNLGPMTGRMSIATTAIQSFLGQFPAPINREFRQAYQATSDSKTGCAGVLTRKSVHLFARSLRSSSRAA